MIGSWLQRAKYRHYLSPPEPRFQPGWYLARYPDVASVGQDPLLHYIEHGWREGRLPHPLFNPRWYLRRYPDVAASEAEPFAHFRERGWREGRSPHPLVHFPSANHDAGNRFSAFLGAKRGDRLSPHPLLIPSAESSAADIIAMAAGGSSGAFSLHPLFDADRYVAKYGGHMAAGQHPLHHYLEEGWERGFSPHVLFDPQWYLVRHPEVAERKMDPLTDFVVSGWQEGRDPNPYFSTSWYRAQHPEVAAAGVNSLLHYLSEGGVLNFDPSPAFDSARYVLEQALRPGDVPLVHFLDLEGSGHRLQSLFGRLFDAEWYLAHNADLRANGLDPLNHYREFGWKEHCSPHPLFDVQWYLRQVPERDRQNIEPLKHFISMGWREGFSPHPLFDTAWYLQEHPALLSGTVNPLEHYLTIGFRTGAEPHPLFEGAWYRHQVETIGPNENPLLHFVTAGEVEGRAPNPSFDRSWYLAQNADVPGSGYGAFAHYVAIGRAEGRSAHAPDRHSECCHVLDIPFELRKAPASIPGAEVCLFVAYTPYGKVSEHVRHYLRALKQTGLKLVVVVMTNGLVEQLPPEIEDADGFIVRLSHGQDFAAWAAAFAMLPDLWRAALVLLANDSVYGSGDQGRLTGLVDQIRASSSDIIGLTESYQARRHLDFNFLAIKASGLAKQSVREFWNAVESRLQDATKRYELEAFETLSRADVSFEVMFPAEVQTELPDEPAPESWREVIERGSPFIKVQNLQEDPGFSDSSEWQRDFARSAAPSEMIERYLADAKAAAPAISRPIPQPKRRFRQLASLSTIYGATTSVRPTEETDIVLEVPSAPAPSFPTLPDRVGVFAHVYYPEMMGDLLAYLANIKLTADLLISTDTEEKRTVIAAACSAYDNGSVTIRVFPNVGRDIAPLLVGYREAVSRYEVVLHIHSKRSPHNVRFAGWRDFLLQNLLGSPEVVGSILELLTAHRCGVVFSDHYPKVRKLLNWGGDFLLAQNLLGRVGVNLTRDLVLDFPSGSFFWARSEALKPLLDLQLDWSDFEEESAQTDGTLAHVLERSILYAAEHAGFRWMKVGQADRVPLSRLVSWESGDDRRVESVWRPLLGNQVKPFGFFTSVAEARSTNARPEALVRPRLNLILPTLQPAFGFEGPTIAREAFEAIADSMGDGTDRRILVTSRPVGIASTADLEGYQVDPLGVLSTAMRSVVDICDTASSGELPLRRGDIFLATTWWTAEQAIAYRKFQQRYFGAKRPLLRLMQEFEQGYYPASDADVRAIASYRELSETIALIDTEELAGFIEPKRDFAQSFVLPYEPNPRLVAALRPLPRERIIVMYGCPGAPRNGFQTICAGLYLWQQQDPVLARGWRVVSVGDNFNPADVPHVGNLAVSGTINLAEYGELISRASVGVSYMLSPHPSHPPLEMALAGMRVITNGYANKDLSRRSENIVSLANVTAPDLAEALSAAVRAAEQRIGSIVPFAKIARIPCDYPVFNSAQMARDLSAELH